MEVNRVGSTITVAYEGDAQALDTRQYPDADVTLLLQEGSPVRNGGLPLMTHAQLQEPLQPAKYVTSLHYVIIGWMDTLHDVTCESVVVGVQFKEHFRGYGWFWGCVAELVPHKQAATVHVRKDTLLKGMSD